MVIPKREIPSEWEQHMIAHASLENVLFGEYICEDGQSDLWYDITGKQSLDVVLENKAINYDLLCRILLGIYEAAEGVENILLRAESLLLMPENIFLDYASEKVYLCYCPGNVVSMNEQFLNLFEYLLTKLDHNDPRGVELAYGIYDQAGKIGWSMRDLKSMICFPYQAEAEASDVDEVQTTMETDETQKREQAVHAPIALGCGWNTYFMRFKEALRECIRSRFSIAVGKSRFMKKEEKEERFVFEPEEEEVTHARRPTVLLAELAKAPKGILRYEGSGPCTNLTIKGEEYLIGSDRTCEGYISSETVSRRHAKITRVDDIYFVEDLNSSNGTYVGGELLNYKTKVSLHKNEIIIFADEKFRFI